jgi:hypothetical protein
MNRQEADQLTRRLPDQSPPISRDERMEEAHFSQSGVAASQTACDDLRGLARQMCYAAEYGVSI